jgi:hypothetical protein
MAPLKTVVHDAEHHPEPSCGGPFGEDVRAGAFLASILQVPLHGEERIERAN